MNLFVTSFKIQINEEVAKFLSFNIEASIYQLHNAERDPKAYLAKAKTLAFNLKKNEVSSNFADKGLFLQRLHLIFVNDV